ncbi:hypothetical protein NB693_20535 [Pantoea ananatis]|uniref:hypothetical protein n=1 Tax=Pantoea ananas TaxID=553 RepID=UPI00221F0EEF|nr:hypothetical protein [Pantoea ananatis]
MDAHFLNEPIQALYWTGLHVIAAGAVVASKRAGKPVIPRLSIVGGTSVPTHGPSALQQSCRHRLG